MATRIKAFFLVVAMAAAAELGMAANITVGAPGGSWNLNTNLASWASGQTFTQGDNLIFSYDKSLHDVLEVNKADYNSCLTSNPMSTYKTGKDMITLSSTGKRYFICGTLGHCQGGMKVEIDTVAASTTPSPSPSPSPPAGSSPPPSSGTPSPPPSPTPPGSSPPPSSGTPSPPSSPSPRGSSSPPPSGTPSSPGKSGANGHGLGAKTAVGFGFGLGMLMVLVLSDTWRIE